MSHLSFFPHEMEHKQPVQIAPRTANLSTDLQDIIYQTILADYVIVTNEVEYGDIKAEIIKEQIEDLGFTRDVDYFIFTDKDKGYRPEKGEAIRIFFAFKFMGDRLDKIADRK